MTPLLDDQTVVHSIGSDRPTWLPPEGACDSHMHIFDPRFAPSAHWKRRPPEAKVADYRLLQRRIGTSRVVVVQPSTYGTDNACTIDALDQLGEAARGVAVVADDVQVAELQGLALHRVCGLRVNFVTPQSWGKTTPDMLETLARKVAHLNWHIQIFVEPEQLVELAPLILRLPVPVVVDHMARIDPEHVDGEGYRTLRSLLDGGNTWVKLSGAYMRSSIGEPMYEDTWDLGRALVRAAPERVVWGSDWPHTTQPLNSVNDASLVNVLQVWSGTPDTINRILVTNPAKLYGFDDMKEVQLG